MGKGRADLVLIDKQNGKAAILEFKYAKKGASVAVDQIREREYAKELERRFKLFLIGINVFRDQTVDVTYEIVDKTK